MSKSERPNILFVFTDQQRWDTTGIHGNPLELTPNFDRMAGQGTHLAQMFTCQAVCAPARASLQTGLYATQTGVWRNDRTLPTTHRTLAHYFNDAGYHTGYIGKWHLVEHATAGAVPAALRGGYQYWLASNVLEYTSYAYDTVMYDHLNQPVRLPGYRVDALTDAAIDFINQPRQQPFFLFLSYLEPHHQNQLDEFTAPDGYRERYTGGWIPPDLAALGGSTHRQIAGYYGIVKRLDEALGRLLDALKSLHLLENTIVVFTSDHGCHFRTRNGEYKRSCHESSIRIPCALRGPGFDGGGQINRLVSLVDLPPTLLEAAGIEVPPEMQGRSILPLLQNHGTDWRDEVFIQISESQVGRAIRTRRWKYGVTAPDANGWREPSAARYVEGYLYDLQTDPYELENLVEYRSHRPVADHLRQRLIARMVEAGEEAPIIDPPANQVDFHREVLPEDIVS